MSKVRLTGYIVIPKNERQAVLDAFEHHQQLTRNEAGCLCFEMRADTKDDCKFWLTEEFRSYDDFLYHQQRSRQSAWYHASINVARHYKPLVYLDD